MPGQMLIHRVVEDLRNAVVERPLVRAADVHPRLLSDSFESFELAELRCVVRRRNRNARRLVLIINHSVIRHTKLFGKTAEIPAKSPLESGAKSLRKKAHLTQRLFPPSL